MKGQKIYLIDGVPVSPLEWEEHQNKMEIMAETPATWDGTLNAEEWAALQKLLANPPPPSPMMIEMMREWREEKAALKLTIASIEHRMETATGQYAEIPINELRIVLNKLKDGA